MPHARDIALAHQYLSMLEVRINRQEEVQLADSDPIKKFLNNAGFSENDVEMQRFQRILNFKRGKSVYFGKAGFHKIQVKVIYDYLVLSRQYPGLSLSWGFNLEGKLTLIESKLQGDYQGKNVHSILKTSDKFVRPEVKEYDINLGQLDDNLCFALGGNFTTLEITEKFRSLVRYGSNEISNLEHNLSSGNLTPPHFFPDEKRSQFTLDKLRDNTLACILIGKANQIKPEIIFSESQNSLSYARLRYN